MNFDEKYNKALEQYKIENYDEAIKILNTILEKEEKHYHSWNLLGNIFFKLKDLDAAKDFFITTINLKSDFFEAYYMLGNVLFKAEYFQDAINIWEEGNKFRNNFALSYANIALAYEKIKNEQSSIFYAQKALNLDENCFEALMNLAKIYQKRIDIKNCKLYLKKALKINPEHILVNFDLAYIYLYEENYKKGFKHFEARKQMDNREEEYSYLPFKELNNENVQDKNLIIYHEQGFGDNIQFIRFMNNLKTKKISVGIQNSLNKLFSYNFPNIEFLDVIKVDMPFDFSLSLLSLPLYLKTEKINNTSYLKVKESDVEAFEEKYLEEKKFNIGLFYSSSNDIDNSKSFNLEELNDIFSINKCNYFSLQLENYENIYEYNIKNIGKDFKDFYDTAVAIKALDLIITIDSAVVHLAGALGVRTLLLYKNNNLDFRWKSKEEKSIWYESVTVVREIETNKIKERITNLIKEKN